MTSTDALDRLLFRCSEECSAEEHEMAKAGLAELARLRALAALAAEIRGAGWRVVDCGDWFERYDRALAGEEEA